MAHTFILVNPQKEPERYAHLVAQIKTVHLPRVSFFHHIWGDEITEDIRLEYCKSDTAMKLHGRNKETEPLSNGEVSLFLNHIECLKKIRRDHTDGLFVIMESDVIFHAGFEQKFAVLLAAVAELPNWDIVNIGNTKSWMRKKHYKAVPIVIHGVKFYREKINRCAEAIVWNYRSVCKFLDYFEETGDIDSPIDMKMDVFSEFQGNFTIYWNEPTFISQGSIDHTFKSHLRLNVKKQRWIYPVLAIFFVGLVLVMQAVL